ncbi:MAG: glycosyltransferase family 4 protein [Anaerolineae bacterium]
MNASPRVLVASHDVVGSQMAGPGVRYWELAKVLAQYFPVKIAAPDGSCVPESSVVEFVTYGHSDPSVLRSALGWSDVAIVGSDVLLVCPELRHWTKPLVVDGYDPHTIETLALWAGFETLETQMRRYRPRVELLSLQARAADLIICASEIQRVWWLGILEMNGRVNPHTYLEDPSLRRLVDVVPYGLPSRSFLDKEESDVIPSVGADDLVLLWGGGLWQWLDPLTVIAAMPRVLERFPNAKLLFPGTRHPNPGMPDMPKVTEAVELSKRLGLLDRSIHFGDWVPRSEWPRYLARADVGLSAHIRSVESKLAFRSRVLDYIWAGVPMVVTRGDATSELVEKYGVGLLVDSENVLDTADAVIELLSRSPGWADAAFEKAREELTWERAAFPLIEFCRAPRRAPDKEASTQQAEAVSLEIERAVGYTDAVSALRQERDRLEALVTSYERGRFVRFTKWLDRLLRALGIST